MKTKLHKVLSEQNNNHILPFFWQHGEEDETLLNELHKIYDCGIRAICAEARPYPDFGGEAWFEDMELLLRECQALGMDFWLLDDSTFPTGKANGLLAKKYPHLGRRLITERHMDVAGPVNDHAAMVKHWLEDGDRLIGIVACERYPDRQDQRMTGKSIDLTAQYDPEAGMVFYTLPAGFWRIFILIDKPFANQYIDLMREDSVHVLIEGVYEPHAERLKPYIGNTFKGFFSDEPFLMHCVRMQTGSETYPEGNYPWNGFVAEDLAALHGESWLCDLPALWFPSDGAKSIRVNYMDTVTRRVERCFSWQIGDWCREHGLEYIGHIIEDDNLHTGFSSGGHFFRSLNGQDMAGMDIVLGQILPGMTHNPHNAKYMKIDTDFFHFGLAKLASSHAHIQELKKGRAMCEIFGAYGWAEGTKMMKWLVDHTLVNGLNTYVPHAFSPKALDPDCPPHFYSGGYNPLYRPFGRLMGYLNRMADLLSDGLHHADAAIYYHAQAEWCGEDFMRFQIPGKILTENQIDFDVIPEDYLDKAFVENGLLHLNGETYRLFILPYAKALPAGIVKKFTDFARAGLPVWCVNGLPETTAEGELLAPQQLESLRVVLLEQLADTIIAEELHSLKFTGIDRENLRAYHYSRNGGHAVFLTNNSIRGCVDGQLILPGCTDRQIVRYNPMENRASKVDYSGKISLRLEEYGSIVLLYGDLGNTDPLPAYREPQVQWQNAANPSWQISFTPLNTFDPAHPDLTVFGETEESDTLYNIVRKHKNYVGFVKYETILPLLEEGDYRLDLGEVGESAWVWIDGQPIGDAFIPPYRFAFHGKGDVRLTVVTTSHLGYGVQDGFSAYLDFEPVGLLGPVKIGKIQQE